MVKYSDDELDTIFAALSDRTRRHVLASLEQGSRPVTELANQHQMSLPGFMKHLAVLEDAGLIERSKEGRVVRCTLQPEPMKEAHSWIAHYEKFWSDKLDSLARYLYQQEELQTWKRQEPGNKRARGPRSSSTEPTRSRRKKSGARGPTRKR
ncbi:MAG TPA: metalloregulator ArsR/SmtB family transcription factor [Burkholderiales bacterium]|nr:metalloregulator ArsR/SmtB family transcription factor [Burkholderiales bacterium]